MLFFLTISIVVLGIYDFLFFGTLRSEPPVQEPESFPPFPGGKLEAFRTFRTMWAPGIPGAEALVETLVGSASKADISKVVDGVMAERKS